jgi:NADH-quinone oxidoreductase subunit H
MFIASALIVTLYLGGWQIPYIDKFGLSQTLVIILQFGAFMLKATFLMFVFIWVRWTIPRFRYDQLMNLGWKVMFPLSLLNIIWCCLNYDFRFIKIYRRLKGFLWQRKE